LLVVPLHAACRLGARALRACCASWTCLARKMAVENGEEELDDDS
jgi:hypothetical protein